MITLFEIAERTQTGEKVEEKKWDMAFFQTISALVKKYDIKTPENHCFINRDDELVERAFEAAIEFLQHTGVYCITSKHLFSLLDELKPDNNQNEYYLTDCIAYGINKGLTVVTEQVDDGQEILGVNNRVDLAVIYNIIRRKILDRFMLEGVTIIDPMVTYIDTIVKIKPDTIIYPYTFIEGYCRIGSHCSIGPFSKIIDTEIGDHVTIKSHCLLDQAHIKDETVLDPFMYIRA